MGNMLQIKVAELPMGNPKCWPLLTKTLFYHPMEVPKAKYHITTFCDYSFLNFGGVAEKHTVRTTHKICTIAMHSLTSRISESKAKCITQITCYKISWISACIYAIL